MASRLLCVLCAKVQVWRVDGSARASCFCALTQHPPSQPCIFFSRISPPPPPPTHPPKYTYTHTHTHWETGFPACDSSVVQDQMKALMCFWALQKKLKQPEERVSDFKYNRTFAKRLHELIEQGCVLPLFFIISIFSRLLLDVRVWRVWLPITTANSQSAGMS